MIVESWMTKDPFTVTPEVTVRAAAAIMAEHRIRHLPVVRGERVVGMVTRSDLLRGEAVDPFSVGATEDRTPQREVRAVMSSPVVTTLAMTGRGKLTVQQAGEKRMSTPRSCPSA